MIQAKCFHVYKEGLRVRQQAARPLLMWMRVTRAQFIKPSKKDRRDEHEGAVV